MNPYTPPIALFGILLFSTSALAADVVVNGVPLDDKTRQTLERGYGVPIKPGRYWYDNVSGVWGLEGGPGVGQILAGLKLGGPLTRDASQGQTGVIVNRRQFPAKDVAE